MISLARGSTETFEISNFKNDNNNNKPGNFVKLINNMKVYLRKSAPTFFWSWRRMEDAALAPSTYLQTVKKVFKKQDV